jgi:hypothetical protein
MVMKRVNSMNCGLKRSWIAVAIFALALAAAVRPDLVAVNGWSVIRTGSSPEGELARGRIEAPLESDARAVVDQVSQGAGEQLDFAERLRELSVPSIDPEKDELGRIMLLREWAETDPVSMTEWVAEHLEGHARIQALRQVAVIWAANDLESAIRWAEALEDEGQREKILLEVGFEAARLDPRRAVDLAARMPPSRLRDELLVHAVRQWASNDAAAAGDWASRLPESGLKQEVLSALALSLSSENGRVAAGLVAQAMAAGKGQLDASVLVARNWGARHPEEAADWIVLFPDDAAREQALRVLVVGWSGRSSAAMQAWVDSLPNSPLRQEVLDVMGSLPRPSWQSTGVASENPFP